MVFSLPDMLSVPQYRVLVHGSIMVRALSKYEKVKKWYCKFVKLTINYKLSFILCFHWFMPPSTYKEPSWAKPHDSASSVAVNPPNSLSIMCHYFNVSLQYWVLLFTFFTVTLSYKRKRTYVCNSYLVFASSLCSQGSSPNEDFLNHACNGIGG